MNVAVDAQVERQTNCACRRRWLDGGQEDVEEMEGGSGGSGDGTDDDCPGSDAHTF